MRIVGKIWLLMVCMLVLAACGSEDSPEPADQPASSPAATAASTPGGEEAPDEMEVGQIVWAQELNPDTGEPVVVVDRFSTESPEIIAAIEVSNLPEDTEFSAKWTMNGLPIDSSDMVITSQGDLEHAWIVFRFTRDEGMQYPIGQLNVTITSNEGDLREGSVEIGFP